MSDLEGLPGYADLEMQNIQFTPGWHWSSEPPIQSNFSERGWEWWHADAPHGDWSRASRSSTNLQEQPLEIDTPLD